MNDHDITVTVMASKALTRKKVCGELVDEVVGRLVASTLANVGALDVSSNVSEDRDFAGNGESCDPDWMRKMAALARRRVSVLVTVEDNDAVTTRDAIELLREETKASLCILVPMEKVGRKGGVTSPVSMCPPDDPCWWCRARNLVKAYDAGHAPATEGNG